MSISATLLVLGLAVPTLHHASERDLTTALIALWPNLLAYIFSFGQLVSAWGVLHDSLQVVDHIDDTYRLLLTAFLGECALIPFMTAVVGTYPTLRAAAVLFCGYLMLHALLILATMTYARARGLFVAELTTGMKTGIIRRYRLGLSIRVLAFAVAFVLPIAAYALSWLALIYVWTPRSRAALGSPYRVRAEPQRESAQS